MKLGFNNSDTAIVIGGAKGIGLAIARQFALEDVCVAILDIDPDVERVANELQAELSIHANGFIRNVTDYVEMQDFAQQMSVSFNGPLHLVYAAGASSGKYGFPFWKLEPPDWQRVMQVNLIGAVNVLHAFASQLTAMGESSVSFISSIAGQIGSQTDPPYSAAKAALINFAQCAAKDFAEHNVRVNTICPGMVKTTLNQSVWQAWHDEQPPQGQLSYDEWAEEKIKRVSPLGRWQTPEDIAAMAVFLASPAAKNITGQTINVDGGQVMHW